MGPMETQGSSVPGRSKVSLNKPRVLSMVKGALGMETQGSSVPGRSKVRSQSGPRLECAGGPSSAQPASDPDSDAQNLGPM